MAVEKVVAEIVAEVNDQSLKKAGDEMKIFARDTKKEIDKNTLFSLVLDKAKTKIELDNLRGLLRIAKKQGDKEAILKYTIQTQEVQSKLTEIGRSLNNLKNQGDKSVSRLGALFSDLSTKLGGANTIAGRIAENLSKGFNNIGESMNNAGNSVTGFIGKGAGLLAGGAIAIGLQKLGTQAVTLGDKFEQASISFGTLLGDGEKAKLFLEDLTEFAKQTPFELTGIRDTAKQLIAVGIESENVIPTMKALGDVASLLGGPDVFGRLTYAFGQVKAAGKLTGNELRQFTEAGIPLAEELGKVLGKTTSEIKDMISEGQISFADVQKAFKAMTEEGGRFANGQAAQIDTLSGKWGKFKDIANQTLEEIGTALLPFAKFVVDALTFLLEGAIKVFVGLRLAGNIIIGGIIQGGINLQIAFIKIFSGISLLVADFVGFFQNFGENMQTIISNIGKSFLNLGFFIGNALNKGLEKIEKFLNFATKGINNFAKSLGFEGDFVGEIKFGKIPVEKITEDFGKIKLASQSEKDFFINAQNEKIKGLQDFSKAHKDTTNNILNDIVSEFSTNKKLNTEMIIDDNKVLDNDKDNAKSKSDLLQKEKKEREAYQKWLEDMAKLREENEKKRNERLKMKIDDLGKAYKDVGDIFQKEIDKSVDNLDKLDKSIEDSLKKFEDLQKELKSLETERATTLGERNVEILEREKEIQKELNELKQKGVDISLAQSIGLSSLSQISGDSEIGTNKVSDLIKALELQQEQNDLLKEKQVILNNTSEEERKEAERVAALSPTEKYLEEYKIEKERIEGQIALERMKVGALEQQKKDEEKILEAFEKKKSDIDAKYAEKIAGIETQITDKTILEIGKRLSALETLRQKAIQTAEALRSAGVVNNNTTINNTPNVVVSANVSNDVDINNLGNKLADKITLSNKGID